MLILNTFSFEGTRYLVCKTPDDGICLNTQAELRGFAGVTVSEPISERLQVANQGIAFTSTHSWLGVIQPSESAAGSVCIANYAKSAATVERIWTDCGCLTVEKLDPIEVEAGETTAIQVRLGGRTGLMNQRLLAEIQLGDSRFVITHPVLGWMPTTMFISDRQLDLGCVDMEPPPISVLLRETEFDRFELADIDTPKYLRSNVDRRRDRIT